MIWSKAIFGRLETRSPIADRLELRFARYLLLVWIGLLALLLVFGSTGQVYSGAFTFAGGKISADPDKDVDLITHPTGYIGIGGDLEVTVCINPSSTNAAAMETSVQNIVRTFNRLNPTTGNIVSGGANNIPAGQIDFESVALHEVGHCLGLAHPNLASESGLTGTDTNYTRSTIGANGNFDLAPGADGVIGSSDDIRGDDVNLHWFRIFNNNPFTIAPTVDSTTYSRDLVDLPAGHSFAANADRNVANELLVLNTEAVMQQIIFTDEARRQLNHDDVATLLYAMAGVDETKGTADDYDLILTYAGITDTDSCDIVLDFDDQTGFAVCQLFGSSIAPSHARITSARALFNSGVNWFFNNVSSLVTLTVAKAGNGGGTVTSSPAGIDCGNNCSESYTLGDSVTLTAMAAAGSIFSGWSGGGCSGTGTCVLNMDADTTVTATFSLPTLTVNKTGAGTITSDPPGINCGGNCTGTFDSGRLVTLTFTLPAGSSFDGWGGGVCSGTGDCVFTISADTTVTATFSATSFNFTDEPLVAGTTVIKKLHITELRAAANQLRSQGGLEPFAFTDPTVTAGVTTVKRVHITELRTALTEAAVALGKSVPNFPTDPTIVAEQTVSKAAHITELRDAVRALE